MKLFILEYIENLLKKAQYEYDSATSSWCAYVQELPGAYAQADSVEEAREKLTEVIEVGLTRLPPNRRSPRIG